MDGAGEGDRLAEENDDLLLWLMTLGGFIGKATDVGVPGVDGAGDPTACSGTRWDRKVESGGAGLLDEIRRTGSSLLLWLAILDGLSSWLLLREYCPSFVLRE